MLRVGVNGAFSGRTEVPCDTSLINNHRALVTKLFRDIVNVQQLQRLPTGRLYVYRLPSDTRKQMHLDAITWHQNAPSQLTFPYTLLHCYSYVI
jgi:hypothetical protein